VIFAAVLVAAYLVSGTIAGPAISVVFRAIGADRVANESWVDAIALLIATAVCIRAIDKRPWRDVWLDSAAARPQLFATGFAVGALAIGVPILALVGAGWLRSGPSAPGSWWAASVRVSLMLLPAALTEELLTRGYLLSVLRESWGWPWAIAATSIGFGLLHLQNPGATAGSVAMVTLAGFFLAAVVYATRSLYAAWMAHFAWNWTMAVLFHAAVSGLPLESPGYRYVDAGPDWATGGQWGPEGGLAAAIGMVGGIALLVSRRRMISTQENA
jgi:membrane protease YdiL (CAAX protease family)